MNPKIKVDIGRGRPPVEIQQAIDDRLTTTSKTVVGAINELAEKQYAAGSAGDHSALLNRNLPDQHPIIAITNLDQTLNKKLNSEDVQPLANSDIEQLLNQFI